MTARFDVPVLRGGEDVVLVAGTYQGAVGGSVRMKEDVNWLAHSTGAK